ncbi:MAG: FISUMP domain-containing protein [Bacteroidota bacterium]|nr:FISUMP domain-containing protein [Bacteroidota bacterium]
MGKIKTFITITGILIFTFGFLPGNEDQGSLSAQTVSKTQETKSKSTHATSKSAQTQSTSTQTTKTQTTKSTQATSKPAQTKSKSTKATSKSAPTKSKSAGTVSKSKPAASKPAPVSKPKDTGIVMIGTQRWAVANLNISTFQNGDSIHEVKTNQEWVAAGEAGRPAWCYYNNDPANGKKYGKLYNWYAVNDPRGLCPAGWSIPGNADWSKLASTLGGAEMAGSKLKSTTGWVVDNTGNNESGFTGFPGGYRVENGTFMNLGSIGTWWSSSESKPQNAYDFYLVLKSNLDRSSSPKQRGESVRCIKN